jgi:hypothetical protein
MAMVVARNAMEMLLVIPGDADGASDGDYMPMRAFDRSVVPPNGF